MDNQSEQEKNTDQKTDQQPSTAVVEKQPQPAAASRANKPTGKGSKALTFVALILALIAVAMSVYLWQIESQGQSQRQEQLQAMRADNSAAMQRLEQQSLANREMQRQFDRQQAEQNQQQKNSQQRIEQLQQQLASQHKRLLSLSTTDRDDWLLAEAEYLMRLANQRLLMGKELKGAQDLLKAADDIAKELDDAALYSVRKALANDIAALQTATQFDLEGIYLQLDALAKQVGQLSLIKLPEFTTKHEEVLPELQQDWQQRLQNGFNAAVEKLDQYIQINRRDEIYKPLLSPEYEAAVRQNVRLMFEQAQMASLAGKQKIYEDSLFKAKQWLSDFYTLDQAATNIIVDTVEQLSQQQVSVDLPDISGSLRALKNYMDTIHSIKSTVKGEGVVDEPVAEELVE